MNQINSHDDDVDSPISSKHPHGIPSSPPPSFRSRASSPTSRRLLAQDPLSNDPDQDLADAFDDGDVSDAENDGDDRQRLMRADTAVVRPDSTSAPTSDSEARQAAAIERRVTELPAFRPMPPSLRPMDGVFANLSAKPERGEQVDEKPPVSGSPYPQH